MEKNRLEAFSDGVLAIIITIMVLELHAPHGSDWRALLPLWPKFVSYVLSFVYVGIYWNNHHHMLQLVRSVDGLVLWANLALLFCLSLLPFTTAWMGENHFDQWPTLVYGANLLLCGLAYYALKTAIVRHQGEQSALARAVRNDAKGKASPVLYLAGMLVTAFVSPWLGFVIYVAIALMWVVPDPRVERFIAESGHR